MDGGMEEIDAGEVTWRFDRRFLSSNWTCIWGRGCRGILPVSAPELNQGCCSIGAEIDGDDEAMLISALAATLPEARFQHRREADEGGVFGEDGPTSTRVVDGACIFLNRVGFDGGEGCALHLAALDADEAPMDWKPSVCWQVPLRVDWVPKADGTEIATMRGWTREDWGDHGETMAWCCTEGTEAYVGGRPVVESLGPEIEAMVGTEVYVELRRRLES